MKFTWKFEREFIGFNDKPFMLAGIPLISLMVPFLFGLPFYEALHCLKNGFLIGIVFTAFFWFGDRTIIINLRKRFPQLSQNKKRLLISFVLLSAYTLIGTVLMGKAKLIALHSAGILYQSFWNSFVICFILSIFIITIYEAGYYISKWKETIALAEKLKKESIQSQLEALKNQINPHFLFNSLNTLASIIPEDPKMAVDFVYKLSNVYRNILDLKDKPMDTLAQELEYVENYKYLLQARFGTNLNFEIDVHDACLECYMVPLSIQMLVENAIKHNVISHKKPLHILIQNDGPNSIIIKNNKQLKDQQSEGTGTGLKNINDRYSLTFGKTISIDDSNANFTVKLPLIPIPEYENFSR
jgi:two-component system, LytTR family, sensor kinase